MSKLEFCLMVFALAAMVQGINLVMMLGTINWASVVLVH